MASKDQYIRLYRTHGALLDAHAPARLNAVRREACALLEAGGLPTRRDERYKYTDAEAAFAPDYGLNLRRLGPGLDPYEAYRCNVPNLSTSLFFVVNDTPCPAPAASKALLPEGAFVESFRWVEAHRPELLDAYYHRAAATDRDLRGGHDGVTLLNTLLSQDGLFVFLPRGARLKAPIQIVNVAAARDDRMSVRRVVIVAEQGAEGAVLFCDHAEGPGRALTTEVIEAYAHEDAALSLYSIEETDARTTRFSTLYAEQEARSRLSLDAITLTCGHTRNRADIRLRGPQATSELYGAVIADAEQRVDNNLLVEHLAERCRSEMRYKYVLDQQSTGAFAGKVYVAPGAQQTASEQTNANICAAPTARAYSQPMLEIYADDVKCNHGSTIGKLDDAALFYMRQRGIPEDEARILLQHAFINDVLRHIGIDHLRDRLSSLVELRFRGELQKCHGCRACGK